MSKVMSTAWISCFSPLQILISRFVGFLIFNLIRRLIRGLIRRQSHKQSYFDPAREEQFPIGIGNQAKADSKRQSDF